MNSIKNINIVILMAGEGSRFKNQGYNVPKPFIEFDGLMMVEHVLSSFQNLNANFIFVIQQYFLETYYKQINKLSDNYKADFVSVPHLTMGAAVSALAAHNQINTNYDILIADSDNIFNKNDVSDFISFVRNKHLSGALLTCDSDNPAFSYAQTDDKGLLIRTKEKEVISNHAICGLYYFNNLELFKNSVIDLIVETDFSNGEFYMSNVYNHLLKFSKNISVFDIKSFVCVGTPEQLSRYINGDFYNE